MEGQQGLPEQMTNNGHFSKSEWIQSAFEQHEGPLVRYAATILGNLDQARDVVQDTFLRLCAEDSAGLIGHEAEWLFTVCRNRALDVRRKETRVQSMSETQLEACPSLDPSPALFAERSDSAQHILGLLQTLPPNQQEVVRLKFQNGFSYEEISRVTQLSVSNVGFLLHTALKRLRGLLRPESGESQRNLSTYEN